MTSWRKRSGQPSRGALALFFIGWQAGCSGSEPASVGTGGAAVTAGTGTAGAAGTAPVTTGGAGSAARGGSSSGGTVATAGSAGVADSPAGAGGAAGTATGGASGGGGAGGQAPVPNAIESLAVPADGQTVTGQAMLTEGDLFLLKATGTVDANGTAVDAEYGGFTAAATGQDLVANADVGVDVGFKLERSPQGTTAGRKKWFGDYRADHTYYVIVTGTGAPLSLKLLRPAGTVGTGSVTVSILRLSPSAPALALSLETVMANVTKPTVTSLMPTTKATVYLLQATGDGKVGGLNLARGDADWMDYDANGGGKVDIGDEDVDYGLGVDEADPKQTPRRNWWGPFRKDHNYFMLFAGTGNTVAFSYYDVGNYGDNSQTDKIAVKVFAVP